jgi:hypothetical protein
MVCVEEVDCSGRTPLLGQDRRGWSILPFVPCTGIPGLIRQDLGCSVRGECDLQFRCLAFEWVRRVHRVRTSFAP